MDKFANVPFNSLQVVKTILDNDEKTVVLTRAAENFQIKGIITSIKPTGSGHINESYLVETDYPKQYFLQRINHQVFKNVPALIDNSLQVTCHIERKIATNDPLAKGLCPLILIPSLSKSFYYQDTLGNFWRLYHYIGSSISYDRVLSKELAYQGGKAFGVFQCLTSDIQINTLHETIPEFHDIEKRLQSFREVIKYDPVSRVKEVEKEISFVEDRAIEMLQIQKLLKEGLIPLRVTHNYTKFNNILFNDKDEAICIVDLDTVMPGTVLYDFGDAIRTGACSAAEDEADLNKINIDLALFQSYSAGYLDIAKQFLVDKEIKNLAFSAKFMTFIIGLRFLTDHIDGDHYYRIHFPGHNLQRARSQFRLLESMEENFEKMEGIIADLRI